MDTRKLEQLASSDWWEFLHEVLEEQIAELREEPYKSKRYDNIALEALSRQKAIKIVRDLIGTIERAGANDKKGERRSFK